MNRVSQSAAEIEKVCYSEACAHSRAVFTGAWRLRCSWTELKFLWVCVSARLSGWRVLWSLVRPGWVIKKASGGFSSLRVLSSARSRLIRHRNSLHHSSGLLFVPRLRRVNAGSGWFSICSGAPHRSPAFISGYELERCERRCKQRPVKDHCVVSIPPSISSLVTVGVLPSVSCSEMIGRGLRIHVVMGSFISEYFFHSQTLDTCWWFCPSQADLCLCWFLLKWPRASHPLTWVWPQCWATLTTTRRH